ncbi:signal-regulatory protein beta-2-like [Thunnus albacares]|uniref:signal-regulatory protein beta-2-like n=1 Tax=Thunnus albacares TaxID=8236 RepID=UPI001CF6AC0A|nr:signal-regulatory protein beta-2-like [Thunnus albacares]
MERHPVSDHETSKGEHVESKQDGAENRSLWNTTDTLIPVITVQLGEPANLTCAISHEDFSFKNLYWYKQSAGDTLKLIVKVFKSTKPEYGPHFSHSRVEVHKDKNFKSLTILKTTREDEGMYHCAVMEWTNVEWSGTYLLVKGNTERTSNYTVVQWPTVSDPVRPGDSVTLQCSVLPEYENKTCPGVHSVYWFRAGSDASHPDLIYTDGSSRDECRKKTGIHSSPKSCVYRFSKNISSSDAGTYYCAVATCGEILFGNGTKLIIEVVSWWDLQKANTLIFLLCAALAISLVVKKKSCDCCNAAAALQTHAETTSGGQQIYEDYLVYSALTKKTTGKARKRNAKTREENCVYTNIFYLLQKQE